MASEIEVELRYKVRDVPALLDALAKHAITQSGTKHIIDQWWAPTTVRSMTEEEEWFDKNHGVAWRIRRTQQTDGSFKSIMDSKQLTDANNHDTFKETPPVEMDYDAAAAEIAQKGYRCWLTIDKTRRMFTGVPEQFEIVLDEIAGMQEKIGVGAGLEIEFKGEGTREHALQVLGDFAVSIGLENAERFERSFTVESMQALADFES